MPTTRINLSILLVLFSCAPLLHAESSAQEIVTIEGREVVINKDGSWTYRSSDRFASTKNGDRVQLKEDGSWTMVGNAPLTSKVQARTTDLDIKLQKVVIETYRIKRQKNVSLKTQTVFYIQLDYSPQSDKNLSINSSDISLIEVQDNNGKNYKVVSIEPAQAELKPETKTTLVVRAEKSPLMWDNVKFMEVTLKAGMLGLAAPISLSHRASDFDEENVSGFE